MPYIYDRNFFIYDYNLLHHNYTSFHGKNPWYRFSFRICKHHLVVV